MPSVGTSPKRTYNFQEDYKSKIINVGDYYYFRYRYNRRGQSEYFVSLPALHHAQCDCNIYKDDWSDIKNMAKPKNGVYERYLWHDNPNLVPLPQKCINCNSVCLNVVGYTRCVKEDNFTDYQASLFAFVTIIFNSTACFMAENFLNDPKVAIWCLNLYSAFREDGEYVIFPWEKIDKPFLKKIWPILQEEKPYRAKATEILSACYNNKPWEVLQRQYKQILGYLHNNRHLLLAEEQNLYTIALAKWKSLTGENEDDLCK